jgi:hypothetical protein
VVYTAVVRGDIVGVEKDTFLYYAFVSILHHSLIVLVMRTPLEAGYWCGHFDSAREKVRKGRKDSGQ